MKTIRFKLVIILALSFTAGFFSTISAQLPDAMVKDMDKLNASVYEAMKIIDSRSESEALKQIAAMKPKIQAQAEAFMKKWAGVSDLTEEEEIEFGKKQLEKQLYKDMFAMAGKPSFNEKIENSPVLKKELEDLMNYLDTEGGDEEADLTPELPASAVLSFSVEGAVPYSGTYSVKGNKEQAFAHIDYNNLFAVEISSTLNGGEFQFIILAEEEKTGEVKWNMESQILIQSWDEDQNEVIQLSSYYYEGSVTFDKIEGVGGKVTGSFKGKFFDDTNATDKPVNVSGRFSVTRTKNAY